MCVIDIRGVPPQIDPTTYPWRITKSITNQDIVTGELIHIFQFLSNDICTKIAEENQHHVTVRDCTDTHNIVKYRNDNVFLQGREDGVYYVLGWKDLIRRWSPSAGDEVALFWDQRKARFDFKFLNRRIAI